MSESSVPQVDDDVCVAIRILNAFTRRKGVFIEGLEGPETVGQRLHLMR
jgi:hypothetical protein